MSKAKNVAKSAVGLALSVFSRKKAIIFESVPDFGDNTYPVFLELVRRGMGEKYTLIWSCSKDVTLPDAPRGVRYIYPMRKTLKERLRNAYYMANAKCMVSSNRFLEPWRKNQPAFFLTHGTPIKCTREYYNLPESIAYALSASPEVAELTAYQLRTDVAKMFSLGYPRNDILTKSNEPVKQMLKTTCKKVIVWYPTFRQRSEGVQTGSTHALPVIHDAAAAAELNEWAKQKNVLLVLKPHFAQDLSQIKTQELSNIRFIGDDFFRQHNTTSYGFVAGCDALITDYSSVYYDYLLCDKPVGLVWEDVEEYRENPGFAVDLEEMGKGGVKIYNLTGFKAFLTEVADGIDSCAQERRKLRDLVNYATDGENARRVTDFIVEKAKL